MFPIVFPVLLPWLAGCGGDGDGDGCRQVIEGGHATEGAWNTMVDGDEDAMVGDPSAPDITSPTEGQVLSADDAAPRFTWTSPIASLGPGSPRTTLARSGMTRVAGPTLLESLVSLFEGTAWAHEHPVTGAVYYLQITVPGSDCEIRVITTELEWQVDDESWATMKGASGDISVQITSAYMQETRISEGPYRPAAPRTFRVGP